MSEDQWVHEGLTIPLQEPDQSFGQYLLELLRKHGDAVLLIDGATEEHVTAAQLLARSVGVALQLRARGVRPGDVVTAALDNSFESSYSLLGAFFAGAVFAPVNPDLDRDDTRHLLGLLDPLLVMCEPRSEEKIRDAVHPGTPVVAVRNGNPEWNTFVNPSPSVVASFGECPAARPDDVLCILCSSGTTGPPKGIMHSHRLWHYYCQFLRMSYNIQPPEVLAKVVTLHVTPNFWQSGFAMTIMNAMMGRPTVLYKAFDARTALEAIQKYKISGIIVSAPCAAAIAKFPDVEKFDISSLRSFTYSGAPLSPALKGLVEKRLQIKLTEIYALTECPQGFFSRAGTPSGSVGIITPNAKAKIVDPETGKTLGPNTEGEIWLKSKLTFSGYYKNPIATAEILDEDGWIHTGDVGYFDKDGFFYVVDRYKELIKFRGVYMAPAEVEGLLTAHEAVKDAAVVGIEDDEDQEHPVAFVVPQDGHSISTEELRRIINEPLPVYKKLHAIHFIQEIPRTATGKIQRRELRQQARQL